MPVTHLSRFAFLVALGWGVVWGASGTHAELYRVEPQQVDDLKAVIGTIESVHEVQARARIGGTIGSLLVKEGDAVAAGDKIAVVGDAKLAIRGKGFDARIESARSAYDKAKLDFARAQELRSSGYGTQAKLDEARANLQAAENAMRASEADRQEVAQQSSEGAVLAPSAGRVLKVPVAVGSVVMAGETIATLSQDNYVLRIELPERHARFLNPGDTVQVGGRGLVEQDHEARQTGTIRLVYPEIKNGRVIADVTVDGLGNYFVGERARVYVSTGQREALMVPVAAVVKRAGTSFVKLRDGAEIVVQIGQVSGDKVEILSGLQKDDEVVTP